MIWHDFIKIIDDSSSILPVGDSDPGLFEVFQGIGGGSSTTTGSSAAIIPNDIPDVSDGIMQEFLNLFDSIFSFFSTPAPVNPPAEGRGLSQPAGSRGIATAALALVSPEAALAVKVGYFLMKVKEGGSSGGGDPPSDTNSGPPDHNRYQLADLLWWIEFIRRIFQLLNEIFDFMGWGVEGNIDALSEEIKKALIGETPTAPSDDTILGVLKKGLLFTDTDTQRKAILERGMLKTETTGDPPVTTINSRLESLAAILDTLEGLDVEVDMGFVRFLLKNFLLVEPA